MPSFATARDTLSFSTQKLSHAELARALRFSIAAEYEAIQIYEQIMESIDNPRVRAIIQDVIQEEKVHAGQFIDALFEIDPEESKAYDKGVEENKGIKVEGIVD